MIRRMISKSEFEKDPTNVEVVTDYPGHSVDMVYHGWDCKHRDDAAFGKVIAADCLPVCKHYDPLYMKTSHQGLVVALGERNWHDDSDFFAVVWNREKGQPENIEYASTRGWTYPNGATLDATDEVKALYTAYCEKEAARVRAQRDATERATVRVGKVVRVVKGRKVPVGVEGEVFWVGPDQFSRGAWRVGIKKASGEKVFTAASNVTVIAQSVAEQRSSNEQASGYYDEPPADFGEI